MEWVMIITAIFEILGPYIEDCISPESVRRYGPVARLTVYRAGVQVALEEGYTRREARKAGREAIDVVKEQIDASTDEELMLVIKTELAAAKARKEEG